MTSLKQTVDRIRNREGFPPLGVGSVRQMLTHFSLTPTLSVRALLASDLIAQRYELEGQSQFFLPTLVVRGGISCKVQGLRLKGGTTTITINPDNVLSKLQSKISELVAKVAALGG